MSFRDDVLNYPRQSGLSLSEVKDRHDHLANLPPELFEMAEAQAGKGASFADKLKAFVTALQTLVLEIQKAEAATPKPSAAAAQKGKVSPTVNKGAMASEAAPAFMRPDQEFAAAADALALSEGIDYGTAMLRTAENDPELAKRYHEANFGVPDATPLSERPDVQLAEAADALMLAEDFSGDYGEAMTRALADDSDLADAYACRFDSGSHLEPAALPIPRGHRLIERRADEELLERSKARAEKDGVTYAEAMSLVLAEDPALQTRYQDYTSGHSAIDELTFRVETIQAAARGREHITEPKAVSLALAEDPVLKDAVYCYFERA